MSRTASLCFEHFVESNADSLSRAHGAVCEEISGRARSLSLRCFSKAIYASLACPRKLASLVAAHDSDGIPDTIDYLDVEALLASTDAGSALGDSVVDAGSNEP